MAELAERIEADPLMTLAVTHRSWCAENGDHRSNERLEFLGDAVIGLGVAEHLYARFGDMSEGEMAKIRAEVVSSQVLAEVGTDLGVGAHLRLGKGEEASDGRTKPSILADATEALVGAMFIRDGWERTRDFVIEVLADRIDRARAGPGSADYKTRLQELAAALELGAPEYEVSASGPDHDKSFAAVVRIDASAAGRGAGSSKKQAEQAAAEQAWMRLSREFVEETESADA